VRSLKLLVSQDEYELLVRWASRREPHVREAEAEWCVAKAGVLAALLERWEPIGAEAAPRCVAEQGELKLD